jgi:hypothetical protein
MNHSKPSETSQQETPLQTVSGTRCCENIQKRQKCRSCHKDLHPCLCQYHLGIKHIAHRHIDELRKHDLTVCWKCCNICRYDLKQYNKIQNPVYDPCITCGNCRECCSGESCVDCLYSHFAVSYCELWEINNEKMCKYHKKSDDCSETSN